MNDDEKNFIRKVNIDKARNVSKIAMVLIIISILTCRLVNHLSQII